MWKKIFLLNFLILHSYSIYNNGRDIKYYENLITKEIKRANAFQLPVDASEYRPTNRNPIYYGTYDFIIIGAGSAGAVVANRLSENYYWKILLLETGKPGNDFTDIPAMQPYLARNEYNWGYNTTRQKNCCLSTNGICSYLRGKALGGTSTTNSMMYTRGNRLDYDKWAEMGNNGWSYKDVLPYFKKSENNSIYGNNKYHSKGGYLNVEDHKISSTKIPAFLKANIEVGRPYGDYNGQDQLVVDRTPFTTINARRVSTEKAFLYPARNRTNLDILIESYVSKILISNTSKSANGVIFSRHNTQYVAKVNYEIIVSAGSFGSPFILMHSGIGPKNELRKHNIPLIQNLDVGQHMSDHVFIPIDFSTSAPEPALDLTTSIQQYLNGEGPLTSFADALSFNNLYLNNSAQPDFAIIMRPLRSIGVSDVSEDSNFSIASLMLHPRATGNVYLKSNDPYDYALIDPKCLSDPENDDITRFMVSIRQTFKLMQTNAFKKFKPQFIPVEGCPQRKLQFDDYWLCHIRQTAVNAYHAAGTCQMGYDPNKGAVVDNKFKVYGVNNLRVVDASIIPVTLSGQINTACIMIGERAADFIKQKYLYA